MRAGRAWGDRSKRVVNRSQSGFGINSAQEAARFGNALLYLGPLDSGGILNPFSVKFTTWYSEAFNVQNYKLIKVVNTKLQSRMSAYFTARGLDSGAPFTCFRVMKYTRKGDLRVEIEAQQYATLEEAPDTPPAGCETVTYAASLNTAAALQGASGALTHLGPDDIAQFNNPVFISDQAITAPGHRFIFKHRNLEGMYISLFTDQVPAIVNNDANEWAQIYFEWDDDEDTTASTDGGAPIFPTNSVGPFPRASSGDEWSFVWNASNKIEIRQNGTLIITSVANAPGPLYLHVVLQEYNSVNPMPGAGIYDVEYCTGEDTGGTFSAPRDLIATVTAATGLVHFTWGPPAQHPELVTGYTLYESDGVTVVMPTDLVYDFEVTLAPGVYTYKLNATDGVTASGFVAVTFTVPVPPPTTLGLIDRTTGNTLVDRVTGDTLESRIA